MTQTHPRKVPYGRHTQHVNNGNDSTKGERRDNFTWEYRTGTIRYMAKVELELQWPLDCQCLLPLRQCESRFEKTEEGGLHT